MLDNSGYRHSGYKTLIAFPRREWLRERASLLRCTYITCDFSFQSKCRQSPVVVADKVTCRLEQAWFLFPPVSHLFSGTYSYGCWKEALTTRVSVLDIHRSLGMQFRPISLQMKVLRTRKCTGVIEPGWVLAVRWYTLCTVLLPVATG